MLERQWRRTLAGASFALKVLTSATDKCPPLSLSGRGCWKFMLAADLLGILLGKGSRNPAQDGGGQRRFGRRSAVGARLGGLSDLYEPYLLQKEMSGKIQSTTLLQT